MPGELELPAFMRSVMASEDVSLDDRIRALGQRRQEKPELSPEIDRSLVAEIDRLRSDLLAVGKIQKRVREIFARLEASPWFPAVFLGFEQVGAHRVASVFCGGALRAVPISESLDQDSLEAGDEVLLGNEQNLIVARGGAGSLRSGETGIFDRLTTDGRMVLRARDEELIVAVAGKLRSVEVRSGDRIRWDRSVWMAYEKLDRAADHPLFLENTPGESFDQVRGLDRVIRRLEETVALHLRHADLVAKYRLARCTGILFWGPPGNGKTMLARALANWLASLVPSGRSRFMHIKPGALHSVWYSASEANYREAFRVAREAGESDPDVPVVMFFDEIDAVGTVRGASPSSVDDRVQTALMSELDGLEGRGNILVVGATNRRDALDPALLREGRFGGLVVEIPRPNRRSAEAILDHYLATDLPYETAREGGSSEARRAVISAALARIYGHGPESQLATLTFRDGKERRLRACDFVSGAGLSKIVRVAVERACVRERDTGAEGITTADILDAVFEEFSSAARLLTPSNCRNYLSDLPQDVDVVRIEPLRPQTRPERFMTVV